MDAAVKLGHGQFYGMLETRRAAGSFNLSLLTARGHVERHTHTEAHFVFVLGGQYASTAHGATDDAGAATLIYNPPGTTHTDRFAHQHGRFFGLSIKAEHLNELGQELRFADRPHRLRHPRALAIAAGAVKRVPHDNPDAPAMLEALSLELLAAIAHREPVIDKVAPRWFKTACAMIADSAEPPSVAAVARAVGVHPVHLARTFRVHLGISPGDYARKRRLERATDLLLRPRASLTGVAHEAGYADQSHFTRDFVRAAGLTPARFRAALR
jgi:AraC family transcriptional regulator